MAVAKSYENYKFIGEPYERDGKMYVIVKGNCKRCDGSGHYSMNASGDTTCYRCGGSGIEKMEVRWYTDKQRAQLDRAAEHRAAAKAVKVEERRIRFSPKNAFGFGTDEYITLYKGDENKIKDFFLSFTIDEEGHRAAWYNNIFHWFTPSKITFDKELPEGITPIKLTWDEVKDKDDPEGLQAKCNEFIAKYVGGLLFDQSKSEYQGEKNEWLEKVVTIKKNITLDGRYGLSHMHIMEDEEGNEYVWTTASKDIEERTVLNMRMKVKDHQEYRNIKQTVVYYCKVK